MQNYSSRFKVKSFVKDDSEDPNTVLSVAVLLYLLFGNQDQNIANLTKRIIARTGVVQGVPTPVLEDPPKKPTASLENLQVFTLRRPFNLPALKDTAFDGKDLTVRLQLKNAQILDIGPFTVKEKSRDAGQVGVQMEVDNMSLFVTYQISGTINGETFDHSGKTDVFLTDLRGNAQIQHNIDITSGTFNVSKLNLNFNFQALEFGRTGLVIKSVPASEIRRVLNSLGTKFLKQNMKSVTGTLSEGLKSQANAILGNRNRGEIIQFLERYLTFLHRTSTVNETMLFDYRRKTDDTNNDDEAIPE